MTTSMAIPQKAFRFASILLLASACSGDPAGFTTGDGGATDTDADSDTDSDTDADSDTDTDTDTDADTDTDTGDDCTEDAECEGTPDTPYCQESTGDCVQCEEEVPEHACDGALTCCGLECVDTLTDPSHCGGCDPCALANAAADCEGGVCVVAECEGEFHDCDLADATGCEAAVDCLCPPGEPQDCYPGDPADLLVGGTCPAALGSQACDATGLAWLPCEGMVLPTPEGDAEANCEDAIDNDCDGTADNGVNLDGDLWSTCDNDCCDSAPSCAVAPELVNPGALEIVGNAVDDDCDLATPDDAPAATCSAAASFSVTASSLAQAMDICQTTTADPPPELRKWGLVSAELLLANGAVPSGTQLGNMTGYQGAVLTEYGTGGIAPQVGATMAGLSTGRMRDEADAGYVAPAGGSNFASASTPPADYLAAHGGALPSSTSCSGTCTPGSGANDSILLRLTIRAPTNVQGLAYRFRFFSVDYWSYPCTTFNDFFLTQYASGAADLPADGNISVDDTGNPITVNSDFIEVCTAHGCYTCPLGAAELAGTGMEVGTAGGGTAWLETTAPLVPGETIVLDLMVFDVGDYIYDSLSLLDGFEWLPDATTVDTFEVPPDVD